MIVRIHTLNDFMSLGTLLFSNKRYERSPVRNGPRYEKSGTKGPVQKERYETSPNPAFSYYNFNSCNQLT
jgi:hypothetical protein